MIPYQFTTIRFVHNAATGEFATVGLLMLDLTTGELSFDVTTHRTRLSRFFGDTFDGATYSRMAKRLNSTLRAAAAKPHDALPQLVREMFPDTSIGFFASDCFGGIATNPQTRFDELRAEFLPAEGSQVWVGRSEKVVWSQVWRIIQAGRAASRVNQDVSVLGQNQGHTFKAGWVNGSLQVADAISFDLRTKEGIIDKANAWLGRLADLGRSQTFKFTGVLQPPTIATLRDDYERATSILSEAPEVRKLVTVDQTHAELVTMILQDTAPAPPNS